MKKVAIIGLVLALVGVVLAVAGFVLSGGDVSVVNGSAGPIHIDIGEDRQTIGFGSSGKNDAEKPEVTPTPEPMQRKDYDYDAHEVNTIIVAESAADIIVTPSDDGRVHLSVEEDQRRSYAVTCTDGVLRVKSQVRGGIELSFGSWDAVEVRLELPEGMTLELENDAGGISISELDLAAAELDGDAGNIELTAVSVSGKLSIGCDAGNVSLSAVEAGSLSAENDAGNITFKAVTAQRLEADCDAGEIIADGVSAGKLSFDNDCGNIQLDGVAADESMSFQCSLGNVSGTLSGSMADYAITSDVDLGENNLPDSTRGGVKLIVDVNCGDIDIAFEED